ncbi:MAG: rhomboid family intramembrane serine protease [Bacteroidetes bacterium]|nr:rhomboid family intramembrane serine protease [Bacteroidota bacterium]
MNNSDLKNRWAFAPYLVKNQGEGHRVFSHIWIHVDIQHLLFNMLSLYFLGDLLVQEFMFEYGTLLGQIHFVVLYLLGGVFATVWPYLRNQDNPSYRAMGASGAVSAIVFAAIIWRPDIEMGLIFLPIYLPAYWFGLIYLAYEFWANKRGGTGIAHDAHIGGAILGIIYILVINFDKGKNFLNYILPN